MRLERAVVLGGGPAGLFLARLIRLRRPDTAVEVHERRDAQEAFGFGVVLSDRALSGIRAADAETYERIREAHVSWPDMEVRVGRRVFHYENHPFTAISRHTLLRILQEQAAAVGVETLFRSRATVDDFLHSGVVKPDLIAIAEGVHSVSRSRLADSFGTTSEPAAAYYIWFGTRAPFSRMTFPFVATEGGGFAAHAYPFGEGLSTFIIESDAASCAAAGIDVPALMRSDVRGTDEYSQRILEDVFAEHLDGHPLIGNNSRWGTFHIVRNRSWHHENVVLLGDAAHTAHFSVGSGTKLAMEDAIALAQAVDTAPTLPDALAAYEARRRPAVHLLQTWAETSLAWWETFPRRLTMPATAFATNFMTRIGAVSYAGLRSRYTDRINEAEAEFLAAQPESAHRQPAADAESGSALAAPCLFGGIELSNRRALNLGNLHSVADVEALQAPEGFGLWITDATDAGILTRLAERATATGAHLALSVDPDAIHPHPALTAPAGTAPVALAALPCPKSPPRSEAAESFVDHCRHLTTLGATAIHLRPTDDEPDLDHLVRYADRIRTETGTPVIVDVPGAPDPQDQSRLLHVGILSGRFDLAAWPCG